MARRMRGDPLCWCVTAAGFLLAPAAVAQGGRASERIEITGSNIKRIDTESVAPVDIVTRDEIERTGHPTIADVLRNLPATSANINESNATGVAPGGAGVSLRGLGQKTTLILINGRRTANYGYAQSRTETFVDLNSIPSSAIERIEVLTDGASAIYGSDAIAGAINIILRRDYRGAALGATAGRSEGKHEFRINAGGGHGDLARDGYNVLATLDYFKRDLLRFSDTKMNGSADMRGYEGGRNFTSLTAGGTWRQFDGSDPTNNFRAISECRASLLSGPEAVDRGLISSFTPGGIAGLGGSANTFCAYDFNQVQTALPKTERVGFFGRATRSFGPAQGYVELGLSDVRSFQVLFPSSFTNATAYTVVNGFLSPFTHNIAFAPGSAGNPFPSEARFLGNLFELGTRDQEIRSRTARALAGVSWSFGRWDLDGALGFSRNAVRSQFFNYLTRSGLSTAIGLPLARHPPVPVSRDSSLSLDRWSLNDPGLLRSMSADWSRRATSELSIVDMKASAEFGRLGGGPIGVALGGEYRSESMRDAPDEVAARGDTFGGGVTGHADSRISSALFGELALPFVKGIEAQVAGRLDHYSDYGSSATPKLGMKWRASESILVRANWGRGFRAPTLPETSHVPTTVSIQVVDPLTSQPVSALGVFVGNPDLRPERSTSATAGVVWQPTADFSVALGYYNIDWQDIVLVRRFQAIVDRGNPAEVIRDPATQVITTVINQDQNLESTSTRGYDLDLRYVMRTQLGRWTARGNATYLDSFREQGVEVAGTNEGLIWTRPRLRGVFSIDWDRGPWAFTAAYRYVSGYRAARQYARSSSASTRAFTLPQDPRFQNGTLPEHAAHHRTIDLFARFHVGRHFTVHASIINAENKTPPFEPGFVMGYDVGVYDARGRQVRLGLEWRM